MPGPSNASRSIVPIPASVKAIARGQPLSLAWENAVGGLTYELRGDGRHLFVKWIPRASGIDAAAEVERLRWARRYIEVPEIVARGADEDGAWIVTRALPGWSAVADRWVADPETAVVAIGRGLRALHDELPVDDCPFSWRAEDRVIEARDRAERGALDPGDWHVEHVGLGIAEALQILERIPPVDHVVVCHGDACAPNTPIDERGECCGHTDLGCLGVADRWADIAIASWSTAWNYGEGFEELLLAAYGVAPDPERTAYYRLLWDLGP